jgi:hypothetical protein
MNPATHGRRHAEKDRPMSVASCTIIRTHPIESPL